MIQEIWNYMVELFTRIYRFFVFKETALDKPLVYVIMFTVIAALLAYSIGKKSKNALHSPFLFVLAVALTLFTVTF